VIRSLPFLFILLTNAAVYADGHLTVKDARITIAPPTVTINAGYLTIENHSNEVLELVSITSDNYPRIEIHESVVREGMATMIHHQTLIIPPGSIREMMPGGFHLMIYNNGKPPMLGNKIPITLSFIDGSVITIDMEVKNNYENEQTLDNYNQETKSVISYQEFLPQHFLSGLMYILARTTWGPLKNLMIGIFINLYKVDMKLAREPDYKKYATFNDFFTRQLSSNARPVDSSIDSIISPVDGSVSQFGAIQNGSILQAKGKNFSVSDFLGGDTSLADKFINGSFITLYLSPRDYHRIHMPVEGTLTNMTFIPGRLFSVNQSTTEKVDKLFAVNERVVNVFETNIGTIALVMVGAIFVGSMETVWAGEITPGTTQEMNTFHYPDSKVHLSKGDEMGRFNMGSTVILLFEPDKVSFNTGLSIGSVVEMGKVIAEIN
jgi:phosphatidylserine decarboxylase